MVATNIKIAVSILNLEYPIAITDALKFNQLLKGMATSMSFCVGTSSEVLQIEKLSVSSS